MPLSCTNYGHFLPLFSSWIQGGSLILKIISIFCKTNILKTFILKILSSLTESNDPKLVSNDCLTKWNLCSDSRKLDVWRISEQICGSLSRRRPSSSTPPAWPWPWPPPGWRCPPPESCWLSCCCSPLGLFCLHYILLWNCKSQASIFIVIGGVV